MPDCDIFDQCGSKPFAKAFRSIYRDHSDPNGVRLLVEAASPLLEEIGPELCEAACWIEERSQPRLFRDSTTFPLLHDVPVELRNMVNVALRRAKRTSGNRIGGVTRGEALEHILAYLISQYAENECAVIVAKTNFAKSDEAILERLRVFEMQLLNSSHVKDLAERVKAGETFKSLVTSHSRRILTSTSDLLHLPIIGQG